MSLTSIRGTPNQVLQGSGSAETKATSSVESASAPAAASEATTSADAAPPAPAGGGQVAPGSSAPPPDDASTRALAARIAAALPPEAAGEPRGLPLDDEHSFVLDPSEVPPGQVRDITSNGVSDPVPLVALEPDGLVGPPGARERTSDATIVRVTLNRAESLYPEMVQDGALSHLGEPERVTLRPGDTVRVFVWNDNKSGADVTTGIRLADGRRLDEVFSDIEVQKENGSWRDPLPPNGRELVDGTGLFGVELAAGQYGGYTIEMTVRDDVEPGSTVGLQHIAARAGNYSDYPQGVHDVDQALADSAWQHAVDEGRSTDTVSTHEQSTAYGGFHGTLALSAPRQLLAAPGSTAYDGWRDPETTPAGVLAEARQAAYNVPIRLDVESEGPRDVALRTFADWGSQAGNVDAYVMRDGERIELPPSPLGQDDVQWVSLQPGDELFVTFGGSSATAAFLDVRDP